MMNKILAYTVDFKPFLVQKKEVVAEPAILNSAETSQKLSSLFQYIQAKDTIVFSDLSGTLLYHSINCPNGFTQEQKCLIRDLLDKKIIFVLVTGDSMELTQKEFLKPLDYQGETPIYLMTGSGHQISVYEKGQVRELFKGEGIPFEQRKTILFQVLSIASKFFNTPLSLTETEQQQLLSPEGGLICLSSKIPNFNTKIILEVRPNKITFSFPIPMNDVARAMAPTLLNRIQFNYVIQAISCDHHIYLSRMYNCLDIITHLKSHGIDQFLNLDIAKSFDMAHKHIVIMGDSHNDKSMLMYPFHPDQHVIRIFVGNDDALFSEISKVGEPCLYLKGDYIGGSQKVFQLLK